MARTISLKYAGVCRDCGTELAVGARARYYGRGTIYGIGCHERGESRRATVHRAIRAEASGAPAGQVASILDPRGAYSSDGTFLGTVGPRCEDAPCCGCCS